MCHWTGIWKALGKSKADVVRLIESQPDSESFGRGERGRALALMVFSLLRSCWEDQEDSRRASQGSRDMVSRILQARQAKKEH